MRCYTQTNLVPGNCWQTAIACLLDINPNALPPQAEIEGWPSAALNGWCMYSNVLNGYLKKHHNRVYFEIQPWQLGGIEPLWQYHTQNGPTVRTPATGKHHVVVCRNNKMIWDPHPSRAGLTGVESLGIVGEIIDLKWANYSKHDEWREDRKRNDEGYRLVFDCLCPSCNLTAARALVTQYNVSKSAKK